MLRPIQICSSIVLLDTRGLLDSQKEMSENVVAFSNALTQGLFVDNVEVDFSKLLKLKQTESNPKYKVNGLIFYV